MHHRSNKVEIDLVSSGVHQGSVLVQILFGTFTDDSCMGIECMFSTFMDNTSLDLL